MKLIDITKQFNTEDKCLDYLEQLRWPNGVECPTCARMDANFLANQRAWQCKSVHTKRQFSAKVGTIFEDSPILRVDAFKGTCLPTVWQAA